MKNKGQVTIFVVLGLVILVVVSIVIYLSFLKQPKPEIIPFEIQKVESFIIGCLDDALASGASYCSSGKNCPSYEEDLGGRVVTHVLECTGAQGEKLQERFPNYEIKIGNADVQIKKLTKRVEVVLSLPVVIKKDNREHKLNEFKSYYALESGECIPCPTCNDDCITQEELKVSVLDLSWTIPAGGYVGLKKGECLAC